jgi:hypothetical protein
MYGAPDRGGSREGKKSLRKTKQNLDAKVGDIFFNRDIPDKAI